MREDICSIPVNDVFLPKEGCPFCRMRDMLEDRMATYITGAAMMPANARLTGLTTRAAHPAGSVDYRPLVEIQQIGLNQRLQRQLRRRRIAAWHCD